MKNSGIEDDDWDNDFDTEHIDALDRIRHFEINNDILLDGFLGDVMGVVYRRGKQQVRDRKSVV